VILAKDMEDLEGNLGVKIKGGGQRVLRVEDFEGFAQGTRFADFVASVGLPSRDIGSGICVFVYPVEGGLEVRAGFPGSERSAPLLYLNVFDPRTGKVLKRLDTSKR
jgi:hypothetical protein